MLGKEAANGRRMLEGGSGATVFPGEGMERRAEARRALGGGVCTEDQEQMLTLPLKAEALMLFPDPCVIS